MSKRVNWAEQVADYRGVIGWNSYIEPHSGTYIPAIEVPLFIKEHPIPSRKPKATEITSVRTVDPGSQADTTTSMIFFGSPDLLEVAISGWIITPTKLSFNSPVLYTNQARNPSLERGLHHWSDVSTAGLTQLTPLSLSSNWARSGVYSAHVRSRNTDSTTARALNISMNGTGTNSLAINSGQILNTRVMTRIYESNHNNGLRLQYRWMDSGGAFLANSNGSALNNVAVHTLTHSAVAPTNTAFCDVRVNAPSQIGPWTIEASIDELQIHKSENLPSFYFDGGSSRSRWTGEEHDSESQFGALGGVPLWDPVSRDGEPLAWGNINYADIISYMLEGRLNKTTGGAWERRDPDYYITPYGHRYTKPIIATWEPQYQPVGKKQAFSMSLILEH